MVLVCIMGMTLPALPLTWNLQRLEAWAQMYFVSCNPLYKGKLLPLLFTVHKALAVIQEVAGSPRPVDFRSTDSALFSKGQFRAFFSLSSDYLVGREHVRGPVLWDSSVNHNKLHLFEISVFSQLNPKIRTCYVTFSTSVCEEETWPLWKAAG